MNHGLFSLRRYRYILLCFYYVANSNIQGLSLKANALSFPTPNPTLNLPDSVNKCKTDIKTYLMMQPCHFNFLIYSFELLCRTRTATPRLLSVSHSVSYRTNLPYIKNHRYEACVLLTSKNIPFQIPQLFNIVLKL